MSLESKVSKILTEAGLPKTTFKLVSSAVEKQSQFEGNKISFEDAVALAVKSFLTDNDDVESPLGLFENEFYEEDYASKLVEFMNKDDTSIELVEGNERVDDASWYPPEHCESVKDNWIFYMRIAHSPTTCSGPWCLAMATSR